VKAVERGAAALFVSDRLLALDFVLLPCISGQPVVIISKSFFFQMHVDPPHNWYQIQKQVSQKSRS